MATLWDSATESTVRYRINKLNNNSQGLWGTMTVDQMMLHMAAAYDSALLGKNLPDEGLMAVLCSLPPVRYIMVNVMPWPKNLPTAKSFTITEKAQFDAAKARFLETFEAFMAEKSTKKLGKHPLFGKLSFEDWGTLLYKHTNHHLKQFGV